MNRSNLASFTFQDLCEVLPERQIISVNEDTQIAEALEVLSRHLILSVPVFRSGEAEQGRCSDVVDTAEIITFLFTHSKGFTNQEKIQEGLHRTIRDAKSLSSSTSTKSYFLSDKSSLLDIVYQLTLVPRVVIVDERGTILKLISQMDVANFILKHQEALSSLHSKSLLLLNSTTSLALLSRSVTLINQEEIVWSAFTSLIEKGQSSAPVYAGNTSNIVGHISTSDLRIINKDNLDLLKLSVRDFFHQTKHSESSAKPGLIKLESDATMSEVFKLIKEKKIHQIYIEDGGVLRGLISLNDIMCLLLNL